MTTTTLDAPSKSFETPRFGGLSGLATRLSALRTRIANAFRMPTVVPQDHWIV